MIAAYEMDGTGPVAADSGVNELHGVFSGTTADDSDVCSPQNTCEAACGAGSQIAFDMSSNAGPGCENCKMPADSMCTGYWNNGGCGGIDAGRCGVTPDGRLYAYYLDAVEWCGDRAGTSANEGRDPLCGFVMSPPVTEGCTRAENVGYYTECCVREEDDSTSVCPNLQDFGTDQTAHCPNHHAAVFGGVESVRLFQFGNGGVNVPRESDCSRLNDKAGSCKSLEAAGWTLSGSLNDFATCDGGDCGGGWCAGCSGAAEGQYAGFWAGGGATGTISYPLPDGYDSAILTLGMHYDNPICRGIIRVGGTEIFNNLHFAERQVVSFTYAPGDVLEVEEQQTCIVHLYSLDVMMTNTGFPGIEAYYSFDDETATDNSGKGKDGVWEGMTQPAIERVKFGT
jgi:hypothetical protein